MSARTSCRKQKSWLRMLPFQNRELLSKNQIFQEEVAARTARPNDQIEKKLQRAEHELVVAEASVAAKQNALGCLCPWSVRRQCQFWRGRQCGLNLLRRFATNGWPVDAKSPNYGLEAESVFTDLIGVIGGSTIKRGIKAGTYSTEAAKMRSICALFIGLRLLCMVYGVIR
jgi:hypothetical protein